MVRLATKEGFTVSNDEAVFDRLDVTPDTGDRYVTPEEMGNPDWYAHPESPNTGGDQ